jgi:hypothetical protein
MYSTSMQTEILTLECLKEEASRFDVPDSPNNSVGTYETGEGRSEKVVQVGGLGTDEDVSE